MPRRAAKPNCYIIAGSNGAGKTTFATEFLPLYLNCRDFINPDQIACPCSPSVAGEAIRARYAEAKQRGISLHIWRHKELENYVLVQSAIHRAIKLQMSGGAIGPSLGEVEQRL